ncbi:RICIN domain-containing protein [Actinoplanes xinjiangensis]|uniref:RICIN domain-containing protein n=1 Tax=Actinoplanes xinjiangensis TaxID=512350 RepID=UPI0034281B60
MQPGSEAVTMTKQRGIDDDRGSLTMAMLAVSIGLVLAVALLPVVVRQVQSSRVVKDRAVALSGARIGLDVVMAQVAAASYGEADEKTGLLENLPDCSKPIKGDAGVGGEKLPYEVTIEYYAEDGRGPLCPLKEAPKTAKLYSKGMGTLNMAAPGSSAKDPQYINRALDATYTFKIDNRNLQSTGGVIRIDSSTTGFLCMDAVTNYPAPGAPLKMRTCNGATTQQFEYTKELYIKLVNSASAAYPNGMCVFAATDHAVGKQLGFQHCPSPGGTISPLYQWSLDNSSFLKSTSADRKVENFCASLATANKVDSNVQLGACNSNTSVNVWRFDAGVGAGMAGEETYQLVNYAQFSRCLDVTSRSTSSTYMIAWFCKQDPNGVVDWNQTWLHPVPVAPAVEKKGVIYIITDGSRFCLKSPLVATTSSWVTVTKTGCPQANTTSLTGIPKELIWNVRRKTTSYTTSYRIEDNAGLCLQPTELKGGVKGVDLHGDGTSKVKVATCSSAELQKWNAPPNISNSSPITDIIEK